MEKEGRKEDTQSVALVTTCTGIHTYTHMYMYMNSHTCTHRDMVVFDTHVLLTLA